MDLPLIQPLYRLGEHSLMLKGSRLRRGIFRILETLSRNKAKTARRAFASAPSTPAYLDAAQLEEFIAKYFRDAQTRSDKRFPHEKADERASEVIQNARRWLPQRGPKFLDVACGDGLTAEAIMKLGGDVTAIDLSRDRFVGNSPFQQMDASAMTFDDNTFDVAYTFDAFEHFANPDGVLRNVHRVLKPGGVFYASFGPLYNSPHGEHQFLSIDVPYCHMLFREQDCNAAAEQRGLRPLTKNLNYWSLRDFRKLFDRYSTHFETVHRFEKFNVSFVSMISEYPSCFRAKVDDFDELIVRSIEVLLRKRA